MSCKQLIAFGLGLAAISVAVFFLVEPGITTITESAVGAAIMLAALIFLAVGIVRWITGRA